MPKSWNASSATAPSSPAIVSSGAQTKAQAPSTSQVIPRWTQEDLDLLVEGIDFDDDFVREFEQDAVRTSQHSTKQPVTLSQEELDALVAGIDFTQDIELEEEAGSNAPQTPEAPERHASGSSASPRSPTTSATPASILGDLSRTSSLLEILSQQSPARTAPAELRRQYSTVSAIDLCSSSPDASEKRPGDVAPLATSSRPSPRVTVVEQSDEEIVIVSSRRRHEAAPTAEVVDDVDSRPSSHQEPAIPGFFARPPTMRDPPPPLARAPPSPTREPAPRRPADARALARFKRDSKASGHAERQAQFRQRWPRTFSYKSWNKDARLVYTSDEAVVEQELDKMTG